MYNKEKIKIDVENINTFLKENGKKIVLGTVVCATVITSTIPVIMKITEKYNEFIETVSSIQYLVDGQEYSLKDLYYVEMDDASYLCRRELLSEENHLAENMALSGLLGYNYPVPLLGPNNEEHYIYFDVRSNDPICSDLEKNIKITDVYTEVEHDFSNGKVSIDDINIEYIEGKTNTNNCK